MCGQSSLGWIFLCLCYCRLLTICMVFSPDLELQIQLFEFYRWIRIYYIYSLHLHWFIWQMCFYYSIECSSTLVYWGRWIRACKSVCEWPWDANLPHLSLSLSLSTAAVVQVDGQPLRLQLCDTAGQVKTTPLPFCIQTLQHLPYHQTIQTVQPFQTGALFSMTPSDSTWMYVHPPCLGQRCSWRECSVSSLDTSGLSRPQKRCFTCTLTAAYFPTDPEPTL